MAINDTLTIRFTKEEVHEALKQTRHLKLPESVVLWLFFYQNHWQIVENDVCDAVLKILHGEGMNNSLNSTYIPLIATKNKPKCNCGEWRALNAKGGMRFKELQSFNMIIIVKQLWKIIFRPKTLIIKNLKEIYFRLGNAIGLKFETMLL